MAGITLKGVRKSYGANEVIHGVDAEIEDGELIVIVGPSGCGKSTLLRMVAGLERITSGEISIGGRVVNELEPKDRDIAMVFQNYALYPHMTVFNNMAYGLKIAGMPRAEISERVAKAAQMLQLQDLLERKPRQLSGGQRQRVAMGRAIVRNPAVFLFDEPLSNLDAKLRVEMRVEIKQLQRRLATTALYVTHDQVEAMTLADRLIVMNAGVAEQIGRPLEVYSQPASVFVAGFIGSPAMNFLEARVAPDGRSLELPGELSVEAEGLPLAPEAGREVILGLRPEDLELDGDPGRPSLPLRVELIEELGADSLLHGRLVAEGEAPPIILRLPGGHGLREGDRLSVAPRLGALHLFDKESGRRLAEF
jgi:sn-glycerol 3-phosphate transport system ATP-binding protein